MLQLLAKPTVWNTEAIDFFSANAHRHTATFVRHSCFSMNIQMSSHPECAHAFPSSFSASSSSSSSPSSSTRLYRFVSSLSPTLTASLSPWNELKIAQDRVKSKGRLFWGMLVLMWRSGELFRTWHHHITHSRCHHFLLKRMHNYR